MRTQSMLDVLRDAHVVDAGAAGLLEYARGAVAGYRRGEALTEAGGGPGLESVHLEESRFRYCTAFLIEGDAVDRGRWSGSCSGLATVCWWWERRRW